MINKKKRLQPISKHENNVNGKKKQLSSMILKFNKFIVRFSLYGMYNEINEIITKFHVPQPFWEKHLFPLKTLTAISDASIPNLQYIKHLTTRCYHYNYFVFSSFFHFSAPARADVILLTVNEINCFCHFVVYKILHSNDDKYTRWFYVMRIVDFGLFMMTLLFGELWYFCWCFLFSSSSFVLCLSQKWLCF